MNIRKARNAAGIQAKELVELLQAENPKYSKAIHSMVESGEYNIRLTAPAEKKVKEHIASKNPRNTTPRRRSDKRLVPYRADKARMEQFELAMQALGCTTMQDTLDKLLDAALKK